MSPGKSDSPLLLRAGPRGVLNVTPCPLHFYHRLCSFTFHEFSFPASPICPDLQLLRCGHMAVPEAAHLGRPRSQSPALWLCLPQGPSAVPCPPSGPAWLGPCPVEVQGKWGDRGVFSYHVGLAAPHHTLELTWALLGSGIVPLHRVASCTVSWCEAGRSLGCPCSLSAHQRTALRSEAALTSLGPRRSSFSGPHAGQVWFTRAAEEHAPRWGRQAGAGPHGDVQSRARGDFPRNTELNFSIIIINNYYLLRAHRRPSHAPGLMFQ